jgi:hypothetical protein
MIMILNQKVKKALIDYLVDQIKKECKEIPHSNSKSDIIGRNISPNNAEVTFPVQFKKKFGHSSNAAMRVYGCKANDPLRDEYIRDLCLFLNKNFRDLLNHFLSQNIIDKEDYEEQVDFSEEFLLNHTNIIRNHMKLLLNTHWFLYLSDYYENNQPGIVRLILTINGTFEANDSLHVLLENIPGHVGYEGELSYVSPNILLIQLESNTGHKWFMYFNCANSICEEHSLLLGAHLNYGHNEKIVTGSLILQKFNNTSEKPYTKIYNIDSKEVDKSIHEFFRYKRLNYSRIPGNIFSNEALMKWLDDSRKSPKLHPMLQLFERQLLNDSDNFKYEVFIAAPKNDIKDRAFAGNIAKFVNNDALWEKLSLSRRYYFDIHNNPKIQECYVLEEEFKKLRESKIFIIIYPERILSSLFVLLGYALQFNMKIIFFYRKKEDLPRLIQETNLIRKFKYHDFSEISDILENNSIFIFEEFDKY